jgi:hypothetical protein
MQAVLPNLEVFEAHMTGMESGSFSYAGPHPSNPTFAPNVLIR